MPGRHRVSQKSHSQAALSQRSPFAIREESPDDLTEDSIPLWAQPWDDEISEEPPSPVPLGKIPCDPEKLEATPLKKLEDSLCKSLDRRSKPIQAGRASPPPKIEQEPALHGKVESPVASTTESDGRSDSSASPGTADVSVSPTAGIIAAYMDDEPEPLPAPRPPAVQRVPPAALALSKALKASREEATEFLPDLAGSSSPAASAPAQHHRARICDAPQDVMLSLPLPLFTLRRNCGIFPLFGAQGASGSVRSACAGQADSGSSDESGDDEIQDTSSSASESW